jgi:archaellum biogenesis ATPase FlaH
MDAAEFLAAEDRRAVEATAGPAPHGPKAPLAENEDYQPRARITLVAFDEMRARLNDGYLVKNLIGATSMAVLYGESGTGKTFLALHLALCIAAGAEFCKRRVRRAGVIYIAAEAGKSIENRVAAAKHVIEFPSAMPFAAVETPLNLCAENADTVPLIAAIRAANLGMPVELIVIDTLSRVMAGANENQPDDMGAFVRNIDRLRAATGAAVLIVHHSGKDASRGARGHSLLRAATDTEIEITRDDATKIATARVTKQREYATDGTMAFSLRPVELGTDQDGDPITSCVVEEAEAISAARPKAKPLSAAQSRALQLLGEAISRDGSIPPSCNFIPAGTQCVAETLWREYCYRGAISTGDHEAQKKAFRRSAEALVAAGRVGKWGPWVWIIP